MQRTTLRQLLSDPAEVYSVALPNGTRRYRVWSSSPNGGVRFDSSLTVVEDGGGNTVDSSAPFESGNVFIESGPLYFQSNYPGVTVALEVFHDAAIPGEAVIVTPTLKWVPAVALPRNLGTATGLWESLISWFSSTDEVSVTLPPGGSSSTLLAHFYRPLSTLVPSGATITKLTINIYGRVLSNDVSPNVGIVSLIFVKDGVQVGNNYNTSSGQGPRWESSEKKLTYDPINDPLWGTSWSPSDFTEPNLTNPFVDVTIIQEGRPSLNEIQEVDTTEASGGTFTLEFNGQTTAAIAYDASAATVQSALEALSNIAPGDVVVSSSVTSVWLIEFDGTYSGVDVPMLVANGASLTLAGGGSMSSSYVYDGIPKNTIYQYLSWKYNNYSLGAAGGFSPSTGIPRLGKLLSTTSNQHADNPFNPDPLLSQIVYWPNQGDLQYTQDIEALWDLLPLVSEANLEDGDFIVTTGLVDRSLWDGDVPTGTMQRYFEVEFVGNVAGEELTYYESTVQYPALGAPSQIDGSNREICIDVQEKTLGPDYLTIRPSDRYIQQYTDSVIVDGRTWYKTPGGHWKLNRAMGLKQRGRSGPTISKIARHSQGVSGGTFTVTFKGQTTAGLAWNISADDMKTALEGLSTIGSGNVTVTKNSAGSAWTVTFANALATEPQPLFTIVPSLTGARAKVRITQAIQSGTNEKQLVSLSGGLPGGVWALSFDGEDTTNLSPTASAAAVQTALEGLATPGPGDFIVTGDNGGPYTVEFDGTLGDEDVPLLEPLNSGNDGVGFNLTVGNFGTNQATLFIRYTEIVIEYERP